MKRLVVFLMIMGISLVCFETEAQTSRKYVKVVSFAGDVEVYQGGPSEATKCKPKMKIKKESRIKTGAESYVEVAFDKHKENIVKIDENSDVIILLDGDNKIELVDGKLFVALNNVKKGRTFKVKTPAAVCGARGTGWAVETSGGKVTIKVFDNKVFVRGINPDGSIMDEVFWVGEGYEVLVDKFGDVGKEKQMTIEEFKKMKKTFSLFQKEKKFFGKKGNGKKRESVLDKKDNKKMDNLRDKMDDKGSSGCSVGQPE